jgi:hypothetical protein
MSADELIEPQGLDVPLKFPLYSDELSKPFNMFNSMESVGYDLSLSEHLDELEAMWAQIQTGAPGPGIQTNVASPDTTNALFDPSSMVIGPRSLPNVLGAPSSMVDRPLDGNIVPLRYAQGASMSNSVPSGYE